jgi:hypothetical protein
MTDSENWPVYARPAAARFKEEGTSVTVTLTKQEEAMLQELCRVRRPRTPYSTNEFFQLLLPQLAAVAGAEGTAGKMPGLRKAESGGVRG